MVCDLSEAFETAGHFLVLDTLSSLGFQNIIHLLGSPPTSLAAPFKSHFLVSPLLDLCVLECPRVLSLIFFFFYLHSLPVEMVLVVWL